MMAPDDTTPGPTTRRAYVMLTDAGDTIATEVVDDGAGWLESVVRLPRRGEVHRLFVTFDAAGTPLRWDVHSAWHPSRDRPDERWRTLVHGDSLFVVQGALIGVPVSITALAAPRAASPWHDASVALLELAGRQAAPTVTALTIPRGDRLRGVRVRRIGADSVHLAHPDGDWSLSVDHAGRVERAVAPSRRLQVRRLTAPAAAGGVADTSEAAMLVRTPVLMRASDGVRLAGELVRPRNTPAHAVVVFVSGSGPQDRDLGVPGLPRYRPFAELATALAARGVASVRFDDRGVGASGGAAFHATREVEQRDVQAMLAWLRAWEPLRTVPAALVGHSDGAHVALDVAAADPTVQRVVLLAAPARSGRELARAQRRAWLDRHTDTLTAAGRRARDAALRDAEAATERLAAIDPWMREWLLHDPRVEVPTSTADILLVHGAQDQQVPVAQAEELAALLRARGNGRVTVQRAPAVNHLLVADSVGDPEGYGRLGSHALSASVREAVVQFLAGSRRRP